MATTKPKGKSKRAPSKRPLRKRAREPRTPALGSGGAAAAQPATCLDCGADVDEKSGVTCDDHPDGKSGIICRRCAGLETIAGERAPSTRASADADPNANPLGLTCSSCGDELVEDPAGRLATCLDGGGPVLVCPRRCVIEVTEAEANAELARRQAPFQPTEAELLERLEVLHAHWHIVTRFAPQNRRASAIARVLRAVLIDATSGGGVWLEKTAKGAAAVARQAGRTDLTANQEAERLRDQIAGWLRDGLPLRQGELPGHALARYVVGAVYELPILRARLAGAGASMEPSFDLRDAHVSKVQAAIANLQRLDERAERRPDPEQYARDALDAMGIPARYRRGLFAAEGARVKRLRANG